MFDKLLKEWADEQGFNTFMNDHTTVMSNLASWLNQRMFRDTTHHICPYCGASQPSNWVQCGECGTLR